MNNRTVLEPILVGLILTCLSSGSPAQAQKPPTQGASGVSESIREIMARDAVTPAEAEESETEAKHPRPDRRGLPQNPGSPLSSIWPPREPGQPEPLASLSPLSPQTVSTTFTGATLSGTNPTGAFPPDSMGAVGPTQFVVMVNNRIVTFNKTTGAADGVLNTTTNTFFNTVRNGAGTSDPRIRYDRLSGRWFLLIINVSTPNRILLAVSNATGNGTITASTLFTFFFIPIDSTPPAISATCLMDYPTLGIDANALYIGGNNFCGSPNQTYNASDGYVVRKSSVLGAGPLVVTAFRALATGSAAGPYTPQGVDNFSPTATEGYFIGVDTLSFGKLQVRRVSTPGTTPAISANLSVTVNTTSAPLSVPHLGNTLGVPGYLDGIDDRLFAAHLRNGRLFTAHNIGVNSSGTTIAATRTGTRWYELQNLTGTPSLFQSGTLFDATAGAKSFWMPSIMVSGQGHAALGFSTAGASNRVNAGTAGRLAGDAAGTLQAPIEFTSSSTAYNPPGDSDITNPSRRWGDYSYTSVDPSDDMTMWTIQEFCDTTDSYGVRIAKLFAPVPATPVVVPELPRTTAVAVVGTSVAGSGFFDPGTDPPAGPAFNHLTASVTKPAGNTATGTLAVSSVTYSDPTHLSLLMTTTGDVSGAWDLKVTNPDGQVSPTGTSFFNSNVRVSVTGTGSGTVASSPAGIAGACASSCLAFFPVGTPVTLTATPALGSVLTGWSGSGCSGTGTCVITPTSSLAAQSTTASFASVGIVNLTTSTIGSGTIANAPTGPSCGAGCSAYNTGTVVTLTPTPAAGFAFSAWGGACSGSGACSVTLSTAKSVSATFVQTFTLTTTTTGSGTIANSPAGTSCGAGCATYNAGTLVTLTPTPAAGFAFSTWGGACSGSGACSVTLDAAKTVSATFVAAFNLTTTVVGSGTIANAPTGTSCGTGCATYTTGTLVTLTPTPAAGFVFSTWSGSCAGSGACSVTMNTTRSVTATFVPTFNLTTSTIGSGTITNFPAGTSCGASCATYTTGTVVTLTPTPSAGFAFTAWSGACSGSGSCSVTMDAAKSVTATFTQRFNLTTTTTGSGTIGNAPTGTSCGTGCATYDAGTVVTLTPTPTAGFVFTAWGGACAGSGACSVTMSSAKSVSATFVQRFNLTTSTTGSGVISSSPAGTSCGTGCATYDGGTVVTLTPLAAAGFVFTAWSGDCSGSGACSVTMSAARSVSATFLPAFNLTTSTIGNGTIANAPTGTSCGTGCATYPTGTLVTLTPSPAAGFAFGAWSGACSGSGACSVTMDAAKSVSATFLQTFNLTTSTSGSGTIGNAPAGTSCGANCASYTTGTVVTLTPNPAAGFAFTGWAGSCSGSGACSVTMTAARTVSATFVPQFNLTIASAGSGTGSVGNVPSGTSCGSGCFTYNSATSVTLTATANPGSAFNGWSGADALAAGCNSVAPCTVIMSSAKTVTATFLPGFNLTTNVMGSGTIANAPPGASCGAGCATYDSGTVVTLTPTAGPFSVFTSWTGACTGATCSVTMDAAKSATASFAARSSSLFTVVPCRMFDSRPPTIPGLPIGAGATLTVVLTGPPCGVPGTAAAASLNLTVTQPTAPGSILVYSYDQGLPTSSNLSFAPGATRANNAFVNLPADGTGRVNITNLTSGTVHVIIDVNGYFE